MVTITDIRSAIADQITDAFSSVTDIAIHVSELAFPIAESPSVAVMPTTATSLGEGLAAFHDTIGGIPFTVRALVSPGDVEAGEALMDEFIDDVGDLSIIAALDSDHSLGGVAQDITWETGFPWIPYQSVPADGGVLLGSFLPIVVIKAHS